MRIVRYADVPDVAWANGAGSTRPLWSDPPGERRVSVAMLERPAGFSALPGMARRLVVLDPVVIVLDIHSDRTTLRQHDAIAFSGDDPVTLVALDGPGRVLNIMCRANRWRPVTGRTGRDPAPIGWVAWDDGPGMCSGDLVLDACPPRRATMICFAAADADRR